MKAKFRFTEFLTLTLGSAIIAIAVYFFMLPSKITVGSVSALALVISNFVPLSVSVITFAINGLLLIVGYFLIGPEFGVKTIYTSLVMPCFLGVLEILFPNNLPIAGDPLLDIICYILIVSIGQAILFSCNASSGGLDIVAKLMNKFLHMELGKAISLSGMLIALSSAFCYDKRTVVLSVLATYFCGLIVDYFIFGLNLKRKVCILSPKFEEIRQFILHDLHSGATIYEGIGAYNNEPRKEIITIVDKQEYRILMDYLKRIDPNAFITVYSVQEIQYVPKK